MDYFLHLYNASVPSLDPELGMRELLNRVGCGENDPRNPFYTFIMILTRQKCKNSTAFVLIMVKIPKTTQEKTKKQNIRSIRYPKSWERWEESGKFPRRLC